MSYISLRKKIILSILDIKNIGIILISISLRQDIKSRVKTIIFQDVQCRSEFAL